MRYIILCCLTFILFNTSCVKEKINQSDGVKIEFSVDTLHFDTVFTNVGSATRFFKAYNRENQAVEFDRIYLEQGAQSKFRLNVDGNAGIEANDVFLSDNDSMYLFLEVTIDPDQPVSESPFVVEEFVVFEINGSTYRVLIEAWGQNANYIPNRLNRTKVYVLDCNNREVLWNDPRPYVIYGYLYVDTCVLRIAAGTKIHVHGGIGRTQDMDGNTVFFNDGNIGFGPLGSLVTEGTADNPVVFQGDRLEDEFENVSGQWNGLRFFPKSINNSINHTIIKNAVFGIFLDSMCQMDLDKVQIYNTNSVGLFGFHVDDVKVTNSLFHSNGTNSALFRFGGNVQFDYCTFANYGNDQEAVFLTNHFCYDFPVCDNWKTNDLSAIFNNCIITGTSKDEFWISAIEGAGVGLGISNSIIRIEDLLDEENFPDFMETFTTSTENRRSLDSLFADANEYDFHLDTLSVAEEKALPLTGVILDLDDQMRDAVKPDIGCYEYVK